MCSIGSSQSSAHRPSNSMQNQEVAKSRMNEALNDAQQAQARDAKDPDAAPSDKSGMALLDPQVQADRRAGQLRAEEQAKQCCMCGGGMGSMADMNMRPGGMSQGAMGQSMCGPGGLKEPSPNYGGRNQATKSQANQNQTHKRGQAAASSQAKGDAQAGAGGQLAEVVQALQKLLADLQARFSLNANTKPTAR